MLQRIGPRSLVIVPGDRSDVIRAIVGARASGADDGNGALGLVLTGGYRPDASVLDAIRAADLFATLVPEDTYEVASELHDLLVKTHAADAGKIAEIKALAVGVPVHRPRARGGRGGALRLTCAGRGDGRPSRRGGGHRSGGIRSGSGSQQRQREHARADQPDARARPRTARGSRAPRRPRRRRASRGSWPARRSPRTGPGRSRPGRPAPVRRRRHAADEHAAEAQPLERRDEHEDHGVGDERRQQRRAGRTPARRRRRAAPCHSARRCAGRRT